MAKKKTTQEQIYDYVQRDSYIPLDLKDQIMKKDQLVIVSLFDRSGRIIRPWAQSRRKCICITIDMFPKTYPDWKDCYHLEMNALQANPTEILKQFGGRCDILFCFPPCTEFSTAGNAWVERKFKEDPLYLRRAMDLVDVSRWWATYSTYWMIENPAGRLPVLWRKPNWTFDPYQYAGYVKSKDEQIFNYYTKKTAIWSNFCKPPTKEIRSEWKPRKRINIDKLGEFAMTCPEDPRKFESEGSEKGQRQFAVEYLRAIGDKAFLSIEGTQDMSKSKKQRHYAASLTPSGFAKALYEMLTKDPIYQPSLDYVMLTPADTKTGFAQRRVVANPKEKIMKLYQTGETDQNGRDVFRRVGVEPLSSKSKGVLLGEYFVGDVIPVIWKGEQPSVYRKGSGKWESLDVGKKGSRFNWGDAWWTIFGNVIYDDQIKKFKKEKRKYLGTMYAVGPPYIEGDRISKNERKGRGAFEVWRDGEPEYEVTNFEIGVHRRFNTRKNGRNLGYGTKNAAMLRNQLRTIERVSKQLHDTLMDDDQVPDWVLSKAIVAMDRLIVANEYIQSKLSGRKSNPKINVNAAIKNAQKLISGRRK